MKVTVLQENLYPKLSAVVKFASSKAALPVLENILIQAEKGVLRLSATDLETGVRTTVGAKVEKEGGLTVPARLLVSLIGNLPAGKITLSAEKDILSIAAEGFTSKINGLSAAEFPSFAAEGKPLFTVPAQDFADAVGQVSFAAAQDESRPILTGLMLKLAEGELTVVGVDGFRLAEKRIKTAGEEFSVVVPARSLVELTRLMDGDLKVRHSKDGQLIFQSDDFQAFAQSLEGEFPEYEQIIPPNFETRIDFSKEDLVKAVQLSSIFSDGGVGVVVLKQDPAKKKMVVSSQESEVGEAQSSLPISGEGKAGTIAFNSRYLTDALAALRGDNISLSMNSALDPVMFSYPKDKSYLHVVMPVRLQE